MKRKVYVCANCGKQLKREDVIKIQACVFGTTRYETFSPVKTLVFCQECYYNLFSTIFSRFEDDEYEY